MCPDAIAKDDQLLPSQQEIIDFFAKDWPVIWSHPAPFIEFALILAGLYWWIYRFRTKDLQGELSRYRSTRKQTSYEVLNNGALKREALALCEDFKRFTEIQNTRQRALRAGDYGTGPIFDNFLAEAVRSYNEQFKARILNYRDELSFRIGAEFDTGDFRYYGDPQNIAGFAVVATNFERLILSLPDRPSTFKKLLRLGRRHSRPP